MKAGNLANGMDACVGSPAAGNLDGLVQNFAQGLFYFPLNGVALPGKSLPAAVTGTVVADIKPQIPHMLPVPLLPPIHCRQRTGIFRFCRIP